MCMYLFIYVYIIKILHKVTLNSKLLYFDQELQFGSGGSFDELISMLDLTSCLCSWGGEAANLLLTLHPFKYTRVDKQADVIF